MQNVIVLVCNGTIDSSLNYAELNIILVTFIILPIITLKLIML